jgi:glycosyltransferase involved in cell wall biosynthesis
LNCPQRSEGRFRTRVGDKFNIIYYGWLGAERGVQPLVEAVEGLANVTLTVAGRGDLEPWLRSVARRNQQIRFLGWLGMKDLEPLIREADLIPSLYDPRSKNAVLATPGKLLKSLSLSVPLLVHAGIYQAEIAEKYNCGLVVEWGDPTALRSAIQRLSSDRELYANLSRAAYEAFLASFSWEAMEQRLLEAYATLLK